MTQITGSDVVVLHKRWVILRNERSIRPRKIAVWVVSLLLALAVVVATTDVFAEEDLPGEETLLEWWDEHGMPPRDYVVSKFDDHDWVFLGEYHRIRDDAQLVADLIPALHEQTGVRHLALELLCREKTAEANELISAPVWDRDAAIDFLRGQNSSWSYEEYLEIYRSAWESNQTFAGDRGAFRLVGLHPCIDWEIVHYSDDEQAAAREISKRDRYDEIMAAELEEDLLEPGLPALIFTGVAHSTAKFVEYRFGTDEQLVRMGNIVYRDPWADRMFFIALHAPFWDAGTGQDIYPFDGILDRMMSEYRAPIGFDVTGTPFAALRHETMSERSITHYEFGELYDGYIMHGTPLKETVGVTCIADWVETDEELKQFARNLANQNASAAFSELTLEEFQRDHCAPRPDHGLLFRKRFRQLPDLE